MKTTDAQIKPPARPGVKLLQLCIRAASISTKILGCPGLLVDLTFILESWRVKMEKGHTLITQSLPSIAEGLLGPVEWADPDRGYCRCPGQQFHSSANGKRDCRITLDRVPTIFCVHSSCRPEIERLNHALRSAIGKAQHGDGLNVPRWRPSAEDIKRQRERESFQRLKARAKTSLGEIISKFTTDPADLFDQSPVRLLDDPADDWKLLLRLFKQEDVIWIGDTKDSCSDDADESRKDYCRRHFRTVDQWLREPLAPGQFTCPNTFKTGSHSRSNDNIIDHRFLVVESDSLSKSDSASVFAWLRQFLRLRAIVDTAGRSLHGWFEYPTTAQLHELKVILPELGCDPAVFKPSQPCRLPGATRGDKTQALLWMDLEGSR